MAALVVRCRPVSPQEVCVPSADGNGSIALLKDIEKKHIRHALDALSNNHTQAAKALGISRSTLMRKIKSYGLGESA